MEEHTPGAVLIPRPAERKRLTNEAPIGSKQLRGRVRQALLPQTRLAGPYILRDQTWIRLSALREQAR